MDEKQSENMSKFWFSTWLHFIEASQLQIVKTHLIAEDILMKFWKIMRKFCDVPDVLGSKENWQILSTEAIYKDNFKLQQVF